MHSLQDWVLGGGRKQTLAQSRRVYSSESWLSLLHILSFSSNRLLSAWQIVKDCRGIAADDIYCEAIGPPSAWTLLTSE